MDGDNREANKTNNNNHKKRAHGRIACSGDEPIKYCEFKNLENEELSRQLAATTREVQLLRGRLDALTAPDEAAWADERKPILLY